MCKRVFNIRQNVKVDFLGRVRSGGVNDSSTTI